MRFTFTNIPQTQLPALRVVRGEDDNLASINAGPEATDAYFTCGDLVLNYNKSSGEVVSIDGYLPYFDTLPEVSKLKLPSNARPAKLLVGDLSGNPIFSIAQLPLTVSNDKQILHAGKSKYTQLLMLSKNVFVGLEGDTITDIYVSLSDA